MLLDPPWHRKEQEDVPVLHTNHYGSLLVLRVLWDRPALPALPALSGVFVSLSPFVCILCFVVV